MQELLLMAMNCQMVTGGLTSFSRASTDVFCVVVTGAGSGYKASGVVNGMRPNIQLYANSAYDLGNANRSYDVSRPFVNNGCLITPSEVSNGHEYCISKAF